MTRRRMRRKASQSKERKKWTNYYVLKEGIFCSVLRTHPEEKCVSTVCCMRVDYVYVNASFTADSSAAPPRAATVAQR